RQQAASILPLPFGFTSLYYLAEFREEQGTLQIHEKRSCQKTGAYKSHIINSYFLGRRLM
ncbi:MAG: hypothetical protein K6A90_14925, partial [Lachnospiraceae bacterium]|nr:hypothetical protein [Lachnospiraceae bacterium]